MNPGRDGTAPPSKSQSAPDKSASRRAAPSSPLPQPTSSRKQQFRVDGTPIPQLKSVPPRRARTTRPIAVRVTEERILELPVVAPATPERAITSSPALLVRRVAEDDACPICHGAGYLRRDVPLGDPAFGKAIACVCKERELESKRRSALWRLSSLDAFQAMTFESFNPRVQGTREAYDVARKYAGDPDGWLILSGACGSGKTHLAAAIANWQFQQGTHVFFVVVPRLLDHLRSAFAPTSDTTYDDLFTKVCEAGLLVLDDLGAEHTTPWAQEKLFQLINHRYSYGSPTVITTNLDLMKDMDDRIRSRLSDISVVRHVRLAAADHRPKNAPAEALFKKHGAGTL
jgi:DNA replication protein DnaC